MTQTTLSIALFPYRLKWKENKVFPENVRKSSSLHKQCGSKSSAKKKKKKALDLDLICPESAQMAPTLHFFPPPT